MPKTKRKLSDWELKIKLQHFLYMFQNYPRSAFVLETNNEELRELSYTIETRLPGDNFYKQHLPPDTCELTLNDLQEWQKRQDLPSTT